MADGVTGSVRQEQGDFRAHPVTARRWAIILAGGDGTRLRDLTRRIAGDDRPKQFCRLLGHQTLLGETRRRVAHGVPASRTVFSVTTGHARYYAPLLTGVEPRQIVAQPANRGTAPAILYALLRVAAETPDAPVAVFPSDHFVGDDAAFMTHVGAAFALMTARPGLVTLLGIEPDRPEPEYGWIERAEPVGGARGWPAYRVRRFWEKPAPDVAQALLGAGCLWNSFVMVGRVARLVDLIRETVPELGRAFAPLEGAMGTHGEAEMAQAVYQGLPAVDFSRHVLAESPGHLAVLPVRGVEWSDLGLPDRVLSLRERTAARREGTVRPAELVAAAAS